mmetsp:Transcript_28679/g.67408  ORF Transcript_28679/g.67408 Transcript_28679/m.67408 type:complete len:277 (-) Transcript_28679:63-893(-)
MGLKPPQHIACQRLTERIEQPRAAEAMSQRPADVADLLGLETVCLPPQLRRDAVRQDHVVDTQLREGPQRQSEAVGLVLAQTATTEALSQRLDEDGSAASCFELGISPEHVGHLVEFEGFEPRNGQGRQHTQKPFVVDVQARQRPGNDAGTLCRQHVLRLISAAARLRKESDLCLLLHRLQQCGIGRMLLDLLQGFRAGCGIGPRLALDTVSGNAMESRRHVHPIHVLELLGHHTQDCKGVGIRGLRKLPVDALLLLQLPCGVGCEHGGSAATCAG